ncbi:hypothetical protein BVZ25_22645 [Klebsiella quasipneumoniae]|jgi:hypothetical protein|nr:hypothetical protein BVZ25_22645 [Klebsiella quasipneumoniae]
MLPHASPAAAYPAELYHQRTPVRVPADFASTLRQRGITMENTIELWSLRPSRRESNQSGDAGIHAVYAGGTRGALKFGDENDESLNHC